MISASILTPILTPIFPLWTGLKRFKTAFFLSTRQQKAPEIKDFQGFFNMDLRGIEPLSESLSIQASPITVILLTFPPSGAGWQASDFSSFINSFFFSKLWRKSAPLSLMPGSKLRETQKPTAAIRQRTLNFRLRLNLISRLVTQSQSCEWLPKLQNPRRNQYKPSHIKSYE